MCCFATKLDDNDIQWYDYTCTLYIVSAGLAYIINNRGITTRNWSSNDCNKGIDNLGCKGPLYNKGVGKGGGVGGVGRPPFLGANSTHFLYKLLG